MTLTVLHQPIASRQLVEHPVLLLYHPAVNRLKMLVDSGELGEIVYAQSDRLNDQNWL